MVLANITDLNAMARVVYLCHRTYESIGIDMSVSPDFPNQAQFDPSLIFLAPIVLPFNGLVTPLIFYESLTYIVITFIRSLVNMLLNKLLDGFVV